MNSVFVPGHKEAAIFSSTEDNDRWRKGDKEGSEAQTSFQRRLPPHPCPEASGYYPQSKPNL